MIRFCDREVDCVKIGELSRGELFSYFLSGNRDDILCVIDENERYKGVITYTSLLKCDDVEGSIQTNKVVLNKDIWANGRKFFNNYEKFSDEVVLLPVVKEENLLCFAYQDEDANREIRQLKELEECSNAINFRDLFPEYDSVTISECNELAYFFAEYLENLGIMVNVKGRYWEDVGKCGGGQYESLDYRNLNIYAEGTWEKCVDLKEYLLRSVSVEFECIDQIYEENIKKHIIQNAFCGFQELVKKIKEGYKQIVILGTEKESLAVSNLLLQNGLEVKCFISTAPLDENRFIGNIPVFGNLRMFSANDIILIDCLNRNSAWGSEEIDNYYYAGYRRNRNYICIKDYIDIPDSCLEYILKEKNIVLVGDFFLCKKLYLYYKNELKFTHVAYFNILDDSGEYNNQDMLLLKKEDITNSDVFLIIHNEYVYINDWGKKYGKQPVTNEIYIQKIRCEGWNNYICLTLDIPGWQINCQKKYTDIRLKPRCILLGALDGDSGTFLIRQALKHHEILMIDNGFLNENLILICVKLSGESREQIKELFWKMVIEAVGEENILREFPETNKFVDKLHELLGYVEKPTSQELFIIFHIAYEAMRGRNILDARQYTFYWETHGINRTIYPKHAKWLDSKGVKGLIINNCRNSIVRVGGLLKYQKFMGKFDRTDTYLIRTVLGSISEWDMEESVWDSVEIKFEDLKYRPVQELKKVGDKIDISFTNAMQNQVFGELVDYERVGEIARPVYNTYEEFLSEFDRMRIAMLLADWQSKKGYPYVYYGDYTYKELQEIFLQEFRFEKEIAFCNKEERMRYKHGRQKWLRKRIGELKTKCDGIQ